MRANSICLGIILCLLYVPASATLFTTGSVFEFAGADGSRTLLTNGTADSQVIVAAGGSGRLIVDSESAGNGINDIDIGATLRIGDGLPSASGLVSVRGNGVVDGATLVARGIDVGDRNTAARGELNVLDGGRITSTAGVFVQDQSSITARGENARLDVQNFGGISVAAGSAGAMSIEELAEVTTEGTVSVGSFFDPSNGVISVTGAGRLSTPSLNVGPGGKLVIDGERNGANERDSEVVADRVTVGRFFASATNQQTSELTISNLGRLTTTQLIVGDGGSVTGGGGRVIGDVLLQGGTLSPGNSPGTLAIEGNAFLTRGLVTLEWDAPTAFDILSVDGTLNIGSEVIFDLVFSSSPTDVIDLSDFLSATEIVLSGFDFGSQVNVSFAQGVDQRVEISFFGNVYRFGTVSVSEPPSTILFLISLCAAVLSSRRRFCMRGR